MAKHKGSVPVKPVTPDRSEVATVKRTLMVQHSEGQRSWAFELTQMRWDQPGESPKGGG